MYLKCHKRNKDGKEHRYWSDVESLRTKQGVMSLQVTLKQKAKARAPGLTPRAILEKFKAMQMIDVHLPTTEGQNLILTRYTQPEKDQRLLLHQLNLILPDQPPPRIEKPKGKW